MSLAIFNGSPRGKKSNSSVITSWFLEGYTKEEAAISYLNRTSEHESLAQSVLQYDELMFVFPLYVDGMPGQVKNFLEILHNYKRDLKEKKVCFIIHSGFSEAIQSRALEQFLIGFCKKMELINHGVIIIPGSEGFRLMPPVMTAKKSEALSRLASEFEADFDFNNKDLALLRYQESIGAFKRVLMQFAGLFGLTNMYWNSNLKSNNAYKDRFAAPYLNKPTKVTTDAYIRNY